MTNLICRKVALIADDANDTVSRARSLSALISEMLRVKCFKTSYNNITTHPYRRNSHDMVTLDPHRLSPPRSHRIYQIYLGLVPSAISV